MVKILNLLVLCLAFFHIYIFPSDLKLSPGVLYKNQKTDNLSIHKIYVDPKKAKITIGKSSRTKAQKTSEIASKEKAVAAINAGYFDFGQSNIFKKAFIILKDLIGFNNYKAYPVSTLKIKNNWHSLTEDLNAVLVWKSNGLKTVIDSVNIKCIIKINGLTYNIKSLNKPNYTEVSLFNKYFGEFTPFKRNTLDVKIKDNIVIDLKFNGRSKIDDNSYICSIPINKNYSKNKFKVGQKASISIVYSNSNFDWDSFDYIVTGFPILVKNGQVTKQVLDSKSKFFTNKHPRTAVGILPNGKWLIVVIDGRQKFSEGASLPELANYMVKSGCISAINLDGGGSSTMVINKKVVNSPSGREYSLYSGISAERPISNAILVF